MKANLYMPGDGTKRPRDGRFRPMAGGMAHEHPPPTGSTSSPTSIGFAANTSKTAARWPTIAAEVGCTRHGVAKALKRHGIQKARPPGPKPGGDHSDPHARLLLDIAAQLREENEWVTDVRHLAWRVKAVHEARVRDERFALRSAVFDLIVAACLAAVSLDESE